MIRSMDRIDLPLLRKWLCGKKTSKEGQRGKKRTSLQILILEDFSTFLVQIIHTLTHPGRPYNTPKFHGNQRTSFFLPIWPCFATTLGLFRLIQAIICNSLTLPMSRHQYDKWLYYKVEIAIWSMKWSLHHSFQLRLRKIWVGLYTPISHQD